MGASGATATYTYDYASRLSSVSDGSHSATYAYLQNSSLVSNIVFATSGTSKMTTTKSYDNLNRLQSTISLAAPVTNSFAYAYNAANQRINATLADGSSWLYQYDSTGDSDES